MFTNFRNNMMDTTNLKNDEKYPLLLVYLDETDKEKLPRSHRIATGAAAVITRWPEDVSTCWSGILFGLFTMILLLFMGLSLTASATHLTEHNLNKTSSQYICTNNDEQLNTQVMYFAHTTNKWSNNELKTLDLLLKYYHHLNATIIVLTDCSKQQPRKRSDNKKFTSTIKKYQNVTIKQMKCDKYFNNTPLINIWHKLDESVLNFAARTLALWQHSGMTFDLKSKLINFTTYQETVPKQKSTNKYASHLMQHTIDSNGVQRKNVTVYKLILFPKLNSIPEQGVTLDMDGTFIATKTLCHTFFEQILFKIKSHWSKNVTVSVSQLIGESMRVFCKRGEIETEYCDIDENYNSSTTISRL